MASPYMCNICKGKFSFDDIKYSRDGKNIVCVNCYNSGKDESKRKTKIEIVPISAPQDAIKLICNDCHYKFSLKKATRVKVMCPYCGKSNLMKDNITAEKLIEEVSRETEGQQQGRGYSY